jgi:hypothetical protein
MSRHHVAADEPGCSWEYGWDPELQTFYARLINEAVPQRGPMAGYGARPGAIRSVDLLMYLMGVRLSDRRIDALHRDRAGQPDEVEADLAGAAPASRSLSSGPRHRGGVRVAHGPRVTSDRVL